MLFPSLTLSFSSTNSQYIIVNYSFCRSPFNVWSHWIVLLPVRSRHHQHDSLFASSSYKRRTSLQSARREKKNEHTTNLNERQTTKKAYNREEKEVTPQTKRYLCGKCQLCQSITLIIHVCVCVWVCFWATLALIVMYICIWDKHIQSPKIQTIPRKPLNKQTNKYTHTFTYDYTVKPHLFIQRTNKWT